MNERKLIASFSQLFGDLRKLGPGATLAATTSTVDAHLGSLFQASDDAEDIVMSLQARARGMETLLQRVLERRSNSETAVGDSQQGGLKERVWLLPRAMRWRRPAMAGLAFVGIAAIVILGYLALTRDEERTRLVTPGKPGIDRQLPDPTKSQRVPPDREGPVVRDDSGKSQPTPEPDQTKGTEIAVATKTPDAGIVEAVSGDSMVLTSGSIMPRRAMQGHAVPFGSRIMTGDMGMLALRLRDGTTLTFGYNSVAEIPGLKEGTKIENLARLDRITLSSGRLLAMVKPAGTAAPFQVVTPAATAEVLGTVFALEVGRVEDLLAKWKTTLQVKEGRVSFFNDFGRETATPMTESIAVEGTKPTEPKRLSVLRLIQGSAYRASTISGQGAVVFHLLVDGTTRLTSQAALYRTAAAGGSLWIEGERVVGGVRVLYLWPHSPARRAGIQRDDVIVAMEGEQIHSMSDVRRIAWRFMGKRLPITVMRDGSRLSMNVFPVSDGQPLPTWNANISDSVGPWTEVGLWENRKEGIEGLRQELRESSTSAGWINLGILYEIGDEMVEAIRAFQQAVRLEPGSALARQNLAIALKKIGNLPRAAEEARLVTKLAPYWAWGHLEYSDILLALGYLESALAENRIAQRILPNSGSLLNGEARILQRMGRIPEALQVVHLATQVDPFHVSPWQFLALYHYQSGPLQDAVKYGSRAVEINPNDGNSRQVLAGALHRLGRTPEALAQVEEGLRREPNQPYLWQRKGLILSDVGKLEEALEAHRNAVKNEPSNTSFLTNLAFVLEDLDRMPEAEKFYKQAIEFGPTNRLAYMNLANLYHRIGNLKLAESWFRRLYEIAPDFAMGMRGFGHVLAQMGRHEEAVEVLRKSLALEPRDPETHWRLGAALSDMGKPEEGEPLLKKSVEMDPRDPYAQTNLARCLVALGKFDEAMKPMVELERLMPKDPNAPYTVAQLLERMNRRQDAEAAYLRALKLNPKLSNALNGLGLLKQRDGLIEEAEDLFRRAVRERDNNIEARSNLVELLERTNRFEEAVREARALLKIAPDDAYTLNWLAWEFAERGENLREALTLAQKAAELEPRNGSYFDTLGFVHFRRNEPAPAIAAYKKSIELFGSRAGGADAWAGLANVYRKQEHWGEVARALAKAAEIQPKNPGRWLDLGNALSQAGRLTEAEEAFRKAIELAPEAAQVHLSYGIHLRKVGKYAEAEAALRKARSFGPKNPFCSINLAEMLKDLKRYDEAVQVYRDFLKLEPGNGMVLNNLASIFAVTGKNLDEALELAKRAVADNPNRPNRVALVGEIQRLRGDLTEAERWLRRALDLDKDSADAAETWAELGLVYEAKGDKAKALEHFRKALTLDPKQQKALDGIKRLVP